MILKSKERYLREQRSICTWSMERQSKRPGSLEVEKLKPPADFVTDSTQGVKGVDMEPWRRRLARL